MVEALQLPDTIAICLMSGYVQEGFCNLQPRQSHNGQFNVVFEIS